MEYFAYGSNMAADAMATACPDHRLIGVAVLDDHALMFNRRSIRTHSGVADVVPRTGSQVWGVLYEVDDDCLAAIDRKEGASWAYVRAEVTVRVPEIGSEHRAITYVVRDKEPAEVTPSSDYLDRLVSAATERGLPPEYVEALHRPTLPDR